MVALLLAVVTADAFARTPPRKVEEVYLTRDAALAEIFPDAARFEQARIEFTAAERERVEERCGRRLFERGVEAYRALDARGALQGFAVVTEEIGKYQPITFIVGVSPHSKVTDVAVMVYRESIGSEVKRARFRRQFRGKTTRSAIRVNRDVIHISGATLSSRAIARGVKKVLHAVDECFIGPRRRADVDWVALGPTGKARIETATAPLRRARYVMGTVLEIVCHGETGAATAMGAAFDEVARLEGLMSTYRDDSEISRVNREASGRAVSVSPETLECVEAALSFVRKSGGAFDPTLVAGGHRDVVVDRDAGTIRFRREGLRLDLGGIGKGYALDRAARVLEERGVSRALLNFGGQVLALDAPPGETAWVVPIRDPRSEERAIGHFELVRASVSTSASYERGAHIVDPHTGKPTESSLSTTVCAPSATAADALSTTLDVLGPGAAADIVRREERTAVVVVPSSTRRVVHHAAPGAAPFVKATGEVATR